MERIAVNALREKLIPYLMSQGISTTAGPFFKCITGQHRDSTPSCHLVPGSNGTAWRCFGCNESGDIFTAAKFLEQMPIEGPDFWKVTVTTLAERFSIEYDSESISPADRERYQLLAVHRDAAAYVAAALDRKDSVIHKYLTNRGWTLETAKAMDLGAVDSFDEYVQTMITHGWTKEFMQQCGLIDTRIFNRNCIIFVVKDLNSRPIAFAARNVLSTKDNVIPKYVNSPLSAIYPKGSTLYGLDQCLSLPGPLWLVEGYPDRIAMWQAGIKKVAAIGGTAFTSSSETHKVGENHLDILQDNGLTDLVLCLDGDAGGVLNTGKIIDDHLSKAPMFSVKVCFMPLESDDPDTMIKEKGIDAFNKLPLISPFAWKLEKLPYNADPKDTANAMIPLIVSEPDSINRWDMCRVLAAKTNIPFDFISQEVTDRLSGAQKNAAQKIQLAARELQKQLHNAKDPDAIISLVGDLHGKMLAAMDERAAREKVDYAQRIASAREAIMNATGGGLSCGKFAKLNEALGGGFPTSGKLITLLGRANIGKTSLMRNLSWEIVRGNNDVHLMFFSLDDMFRSMAIGFVSLNTGLNQDFINRRELLEKYPAHKDSVWKSFDELEAMKDRLLIRDSRDGSSLISMERAINEAVTKYSDKKVMVILDSFQCLTDVGDEEPGTIQRITKRIKGIAQTYNVPVLMNVELKKTEWKGRTNLGDARGSVAFEFASDAVLILHQPYHMDRYSAMIWKNKEQTEPINEIEFAKNKITGYKKSIYMKFTTRKSRMDEMTDAEIAPIILKERERMSAQRSESWRKPNGLNGKSVGGPDAGHAVPTTAEPSGSGD